jgi:hypothetical protein
MLKRILLFALVGIIAVMVTLTMTKPERPAHYDAVKGLALKTVDHELTGNPVTAGYAALGTMTALNKIDEYLQRNLIIREHTFYNSGVLIYKDYFIPVSIGVMGKVYLTVSEDDMKRVIEKPEIKQLLDLKKHLKR